MPVTFKKHKVFFSAWQGIYEVRDHMVFFLSLHAYKLVPVFKRFGGGEGVCV